MSASTTIVGNLTRDPELNYSNSGTAYAKFSVAVNKGKKNKDGSFDNTPHYFDGTCFSELAENAAETLTTGDKVIVVGELDYNSYEDKDGNKRTKVSIIAKSIGAALDRATAQITRQDAPAPKSNGRNTSSQKSSRPSTARQTRSSRYDEDEEPF